MSSTHLIAGAGVALMCATAVADPIFDTFGPLPEATFGGQGIPNTEVAAGTQFTDGDMRVLTIAMSATQRFSNPALTNDSDGTYFAGPGSNFGGNGESSDEGALWNFNFYVDIDDMTGDNRVLTDYQIDLYYDFDPGVDTPFNELGRINITNSIIAAENDPMDPLPPGGTRVEGSQNLLFSFLGLNIPGLVDAPDFAAFDPNAAGEYSFLLTVSRLSGVPLETVAIDVVVVPSTSTLAMLGPVGLVAMRRRRK